MDIKCGTKITDDEKVRELAEIQAGIFRDTRVYLDKIIQERAPEGMLTTMFVNTLHDFKLWYEAIDKDLKDIHELD